MQAVKCRVKGSSFIGAFATVTEKFLFASNLNEKETALLTKVLGVRSVNVSVSGSNLVGLLSRGNSNGIVFSNLVYDEEIRVLRSMGLDMNIAVVESDLNAIGCNVLANDRIAIVDVDYDAGAKRQIGDALGVEVVGAKIGGFRAMGANNILTNNGLVMNNRGSESEKEHLDRISGFDSVRTTGNTGSVHIGLSTLANTNGVAVGDETTGYELERILEALEQ